MSDLLAEFKATAARLEVLAQALVDKCKIPEEPAPELSPTIRQIVEIVSRHFKVTRGQILGAQRNPAFVTPRHIAMYLAREMTFHSLPSIGRFMGGRDHTTVLHAVRKVDYQLKYDARLAPTLETLRSTIKSELFVP